MAAHEIDIGRFGEQVAGSFLQENGYTIIERNWRYQKGELDLICTSGKKIVFVEVKTRSEEGQELALESLRHHQKLKLMRAASHYLCKQGLWEKECRFDFICVTIGSEVKIDHVKNAIEFSLMGGSNAPWQPW